MKIVCISCELGAPEIPEEEYAAHMQNVHGGGQIASIQQAKSIKANIPQGMDLPPGVKAEDLPSPDFIATVAEMERLEKEEKSKPKLKPQETTVKDSPPDASNPVAQKKPILLTYSYTGDCDNGHGVSTLEMDVEGKHFCIAFCLQCNKQIESKEVANLKEPKFYHLAVSTAEDPVVEPIKKGKVK